MHRLLLLMLLTSYFVTEANAQCNMACNSMLNVALTNSQPTEVTPEMILEGNYDNCNNFQPQVELKYLSNGNAVPTSPIVTINEVGQTLTAIVTDITSGTSCWSELNVQNYQTIDNTVRTCYGEVLTEYTFSVKSEDPTVTLNTSVCELNRDNIKDYLNCVAEQNTLDPSNHYILELDLSDDYLNGVSTLDQVFIQRHILAITPFQNSCEVLAADVNNDGRITVIDVILIRELILGRILSLPDVPAWLYVNAEALNMSQGQDPELTDLKFKQSEFPLSQLEIIGIKTADLNGSTSN